jgi:hypothetical protein
MTTADDDHAFCSFGSPELLSALAAQHRLIVISLLVSGAVGMDAMVHIKSTDRLSSAPHSLSLVDLSTCSCLLSPFSFALFLSRHLLSYLS